MATITLKGTEFHTNGDLPAVGAQAPDFLLTTKDLADVSLADYAGKKKLISIVPSLDTPVCQLSTKKFNEHAKQFPNTVILIVAAALPFAMGRFCGAEGLDYVMTLSMVRGREIAEECGLFSGGGRCEAMTGRALMVLDENNTVISSELVTEVADEPNYDAALAKLN